MIKARMFLKKINFSKISEMFLLQNMPCSKNDVDIAYDSEYTLLHIKSFSPIIIYVYTHFRIMKKKWNRFLFIIFLGKSKINVSNGMLS